MDVINDNELNRLMEIFKNTSVNYKEKEQYQKDLKLKTEFNRLGLNDFFASKQLSPSNLPTESILISGKPMIGKTLIMLCWKELLEESEKEKKYYGTYSDDYSFKWIDERETDRYYRQIENNREAPNKLIKRKYYFLDDFCFQPYNFSGATLASGFIDYQNSLLRFLEINKDIIVIGSTNNKPSECLKEPSKTLDESRLYVRAKAIFKKKINL